MLLHLRIGGDVADGSDGSLSRYLAYRIRVITPSHRWGGPDGSDGSLSRYLASAYVLLLLRIGGVGLTVVTVA